MSDTMNFSRRHRMGDLTLQSATQETGMAVTRSETIPAAQTGNLVVRSGNDTGNVSLASGHGIGNGSPVDIYWDGGSRYGMQAGNISNNTMPVSGGSGDILPLALTTLQVAVPTDKLFAVDGDAAVGIMIQSPVNAVVQFLLGNGTSVYDHVITTTSVYDWETADGNCPISGNITNILISHRDLSPQVIHVGVFVP